MKKSEKEIWKNVVNNMKDEKLTLGKITTYDFLTGHLYFSLARYKFAKKMIGESKNILEFGCGEGIGSLLFSQNNCKVTGIDFCKDAITWAKDNIKDVEFKYDDFLDKEYGKFDAVVAMDVIEHLYKKNEKLFLETVCNNLHSSGFCIVGTPNITAKKYSSEASKLGHVNLFSAERLKKLFETKFHNVFMFGMNDEVVHTGFSPMCHYLILLACNLKPKD